MLVAAESAFVVEAFGESEIVVSESGQEVLRVEATDDVKRAEFGGPEYGMTGRIEMYPHHAEIMCVVVLRELHSRGTERYFELRRRRY